MDDYTARITAALGDATALASLAIELAREVTRLSAEAAVLDARRKKDADRKRKTPRNSEDVHGTHGNGADAPPPQVSPSFPGPHTTPSFPPTPLPPQAPQGNDEQKLADRAPEAWPLVVQFLAVKEPHARAPWVGRFTAALDRPPHPTGQELADALGDFMTTPRDQWVPALFRRYVERIRRDADRATARAATPTSRPARATESDAGRVFAAIRALVRTTHQPGQQQRRFIPRAEVEALGPDAVAAYDAVGGAQRFLDQDEKVGFLLRDFANAYRPQLTGVA